MDRAKLVGEFMSTPSEVHQFVNGYAAGWNPSKGLNAAPETEPHYWKAGFIAGEVGKPVVLAGSWVIANAVL